MTIVRPTERLTREQKELVRSVPGVAEKAERDVRRTWGTGGLEKNDRLQLAHLGIYRAAQRFKAEKLVPFAKWSYFKATRTIRDAILQRARQNDPFGKARVAASTAFLISATIRGVEEASDPDNVRFGKLLRFGEDCLIDELGGMVSAIDTMTPEDRLTARDEWKTLLDALVASLADLSPELRSLLRRRYTEGLDLKETAAAEGVCYETTLERHQEALRLLRARMRRFGVTRAPDVEDDAGWGDALIAALVGS